MEKKISVILPTYNGEKYISNAIKSVLEQTYTNIELIIVNDCSKDNTLQIITEYASKDSRIKILNNKTNLKLPSSLNVGFVAATGEYFTWTSDDNVYHSEALEKMVNILNKDQSIDLVYSDFSIIDTDGNYISEIKKGEPQEIRFCSNIGACFLYRSSLAKNVGEYDPDMFLAEDYEFFIRCYKKGKFYHLAEDLYDYRQHSSSLTSTRQKDIAHQTYVVMNKHFDFLLSECYTQNDRNRFFHELLSLLCDPKERKQSRKRFYELDSKFAKADRQLRFIQFLKTILYLPGRLLFKMKSHVVAQ